MEPQPSPLDLDPLVRAALAECGTKEERQALLLKLFEKEVEEQKLLACSDDGAREALRKLFEKRAEEETKRKNAEEVTKRQIVINNYELEAKRLKNNNLVGSTTNASSAKRLRENKRWTSNMKPQYEGFKSAFDQRWKDEATAKKKKEEIFKALKTLKACKDESALQNKLRDIVFPLFIHDEARWDLIDTSSKPYLSGFKPDFTLLESGKLPSELTMQACIEIKSDTAAFTDSHKGQGWTYMRLQLECQLWRNAARVALIGPKGVIMLVADRKPGESVFHSATVTEYVEVSFDDENAVYVLDDFLYQQFAATPAFPKDFNLFNGGLNQALSFDIDLTQVLLLKSSLITSVFNFQASEVSSAAGDGGKKGYVLKIVRDKPSFETEKKILTKLQSMSVSGVSQLVGWYDERHRSSSADFPRALLFENHGLNINQHRGRGLKDCLLKTLDTLNKVHDAGIIHRDIRPSNILVKGFVGENAVVQSTVTLIDFGLSIDTSEPSPADSPKSPPADCYVGTPAYSPQRHLELLRQSSTNMFVYSRSTDLESLVKTWVVLTLRDEVHRTLVAWSEGATTDPKACVQLHEWWKHLFESFKLFGDCYLAAQEGRGDDVRAFFEQNSALNDDGKVVST